MNHKFYIKIFFLSFLVLTLASCSSTESSIEGRWSSIRWSSIETDIEFFKDKTCSIEIQDEVLAGEWQVLDDKRIRIDFKLSGTNSTAIGKLDDEKNLIIISSGSDYLQGTYYREAVLAICRQCEEDSRYIANALASYFATPTNRSVSKDSLVADDYVKTNLSSDNTWDIDATNLGKIEIEVTDVTGRCPEVYRGKRTKESNPSLYWDDHTCVRIISIGNGDGTVTDNDTGLMWAQNTADIDGDGDLDADDEVNWKNARAWCENLSLAGYDDWRLPTKNELLSIVDDDAKGPAIDTDYFPDTMSSKYWSSTARAGNTDYAWFVSFLSGYDNDKSKSLTYYVRAVRGGQ